MISSVAASIVVWTLIGYLFGSVPFGLLLTRWAGGSDLRSIGSGNIGATNVLRTGRKDLAAATLFLDAAKATGPVLVAGRHGEIFAIAAAIGAFLGHVFPVWLSFRGGKGVATLIGSLLGLWWPAGIVFCCVWLIVAIATRYSSASALSASLSAPLFLYAIGRRDEAIVCLCLAGVLWFTHRANIKRLMSGTESKIGRP